MSDAGPCPGARAIPASLALLVACSGSRVPLPDPDAATVRAVEQEAAGASREDLDIDESRRLCELVVARDGGAAGLDDETRDDVVARYCAALGDELGMEPVELTRIAPAQLRALGGRLPADEQAGAFAAAGVVEDVQEPVHARIRAVATRVLGAAGRGDLGVVTDAQVGLNAFVPVERNATTIYVGTELGVAAQSDDELACVLGHELAHLTEGHTESGAWVNTGKRVIATLAAGAAGAALAYATGRAPTAAEMQAAGSLGEATGFLVADVPLRLGGWERDQEREADAVGTLWAMQAGYAPEACADFMLRMARMEAATGATEGLRWWRVHPVAADRVAALRELAARLRATSGVAAP
jgi:predicted Zn-dependent protease